MDDLIQDFESSLDISPILPSKSESKIHGVPEEKEMEVPEFSMASATSLDTDDIPRIQPLHLTDTDSASNHSPHGIKDSLRRSQQFNHQNKENERHHFNRIHSSKEEVEIESDCNSFHELKEQEASPSPAAHPDSSRDGAPPFDSASTLQEVPSVPEPQHRDQERFIEAEQQRSQCPQMASGHSAMASTLEPNTPLLPFTQPATPPTIHLQNNSAHHQLHGAQHHLGHHGHHGLHHHHHHDVSQSYDFAAMQQRYGHSASGGGHHLSWSQPAPPQRFPFPADHRRPAPQWDAMQRSHPNLGGVAAAAGAAAAGPDVSYFPPQKLHFPSKSSSWKSSANSNGFTLSSKSHPSRSETLGLPTPMTTVTNSADSLRPEMKESAESGPRAPSEVAVPAASELADITEEDEDANLFMPITPALSASALRALLSHLRRKCRTLQLRTRQQNKYILSVRESSNALREQLSSDKLKIYDLEQNILMLQSQSERSTLEYLRGAELHQTRQEMAFLMERAQDLEGQNQGLLQQHKVQQLDHEAATTAMEEEYERLLRELTQHKVLFDQRGREIEQLRRSGDAERSEMDSKLESTAKAKQDNEEKLCSVAEQLAALRADHEDLKTSYDGAVAEKEALRTSLRESQLQNDEKEQALISLQRVRDNLEQEIEALSRSNRNFREIRDKSTSQLLEGQQQEMETLKTQIAAQYDRFLEEERVKNERLQQLLQEKQSEILEARDSEMRSRRTQSENDDFKEALERIEVENHELRRKLEEIQFGPNPFPDGHGGGGLGGHYDAVAVHRPPATERTVDAAVQTERERKEESASLVDPYDPRSSAVSSSMDDFGRMMLRAAKEEVEQLRRTNEKLMKLHAKNHFRRPRVQDQCTQTRCDALNQTMASTNSSFLTITSEQTQKLDKMVEAMDLHESAMDSDRMLIHDTSCVTTEDSSFVQGFGAEISAIKES